MSLVRQDFRRIELRMLRETRVTYQFDVSNKNLLKTNKKAEDETRVLLGRV